MAGGPAEEHGDLAMSHNTPMVDIQGENAIQLALAGRKSFLFENVSWYVETSATRLASYVAVHNSCMRYRVRESSTEMWKPRWYSCNEHIPTEGQSNDTC